MHLHVWVQNLGRCLNTRPHKTRLRHCRPHAADASLMDRTMFALRESRSSNVLSSVILPSSLHSTAGIQLLSSQRVIRVRNDGCGCAPTCQCFLANGIAEPVPIEGCDPQLTSFDVDVYHLSSNIHCRAFTSNEWCLIQSKVPWMPAEFNR